MALQGTFRKTITANGLMAEAVLPNVYMRLSELRLSNHYTHQGEPPVMTKRSEVHGTLDIYALASDPVAGVLPLTSQEYTCAHAINAVIEVELYTALMSRPEFVGCVLA